MSILVEPATVESLCVAYTAVGRSTGARRRSRGPGRIGALPCMHAQCMRRRARACTRGGAPRPAGHCNVHKEGVRASVPRVVRRSGHRPGTKISPWTVCGCSPWISSLAIQCTIVWTVRTLRTGLIQFHKRFHKPLHNFNSQTSALWSTSMKTRSHRVKHTMKLQKHGSPPLMKLFLKKQLYQLRCAKRGLIHTTLSHCFSDD